MSNLGYSINKNVNLILPSKKYNTEIKLSGNEYIKMHVSEQVGLLHDSNKLLLTDFSVAVSVGFVNHFLKLVVIHRFAQLPSYSLQILQGNLPSGVVVEKPERFQDFLSGISFADLGCH